MGKDSELLDNVIIFLIVLVSGILIFSQYQFYSLLQNSYMIYISMLLILGLAGLLVWMFLEKKPAHTHAGHEHMQHELSTRTQSKPLTLVQKISYGLVAVVAVMILFNHVQISQASALAGFKGIGSNLAFFSKSTKTSLALTGDPNQDAVTVVIPRGTPFYGEALGASFEDPIKSLEIIAQLDPSYGKAKIQLTAEEKQRYIKIGMTPSMGCEYCCGADTLVTKNGQPTCGCKHSWAMRGLAAYLVKNYPQLSDEEIMREMAKWKGLFFPKQMIKKYIQESQTGQYTPDIASLLLDVDESKIKEIKTSASAQNTQSPASDTLANIQDLPDMVGGC